MSIERVFTCDSADCERHVRTPGTHPPTFITVTEDAGEPLHFCSWDCVLRFAAEKPPSEVVPLGDAAG
jgi:hypothetical protein